MKNTTIYPKVTIGLETTIDSFCILGQPPRHTKAGERPLIIGEHSVIRAFTIIYAGTTIGANFQSGHHVMIREDNTIGNNVSIGSNSTIEFGNLIGDGVRIHSGCFLERATLEDNVFIGPNVVFTDDPHPMCPRYLECKTAAHIGKNTRIGANTTLLPGIRIGENSLIGAGSVVTRDIPANSVAAGNPAKILKSIDDLICETEFFERPYTWLKS